MYDGEERSYLWEALAECDSTPPCSERPSAGVQIPARGIDDIKVIGWGLVSHCSRRFAVEPDIETENPCYRLRQLWKIYLCLYGRVCVCVIVICLADMDTDHNKPRGTTVRNGLVDLLAGTLGGVANVFIGQPLDTVKVKMQTFPQLYSNAIVCIKETVRQDGLRRGLYAGTGPALVANVAENAALFAAYGFCQRAVGKATGKTTVDELSSLENAAAGGLASIFSSLTLCPTELVKCRLQALRETTGSGSTGTMASMCRSIYREEGMRGFFRGLGATVAREMPGYFAFFGGYEVSRHCFAHYYGCPKNDIGIFGTAFSGGVAGVSIWLVIFPADLIKSRMQVIDSAELRKATTWQVGYSIVKGSGVRGLYRGLAPTLVRTFPCTGILFIVVESTKKLLAV